MDYLMESAGEGQRLIAQARSMPSIDRLVASGLRAGMKVLDAGCGAGAIAPDMLSIIGPEGRLTGFDANAQRVEEARKFVQDSRADFRVANILSTGFADGSFDFTWSQFVFEYLPAPELALAELIRVTRPGGRIAVSEIDRFGLDFWPANESLQRGIEVFLAAVKPTGFDVNSGRKHFHHFRKAGLKRLHVHPSTHYVVAGAADQRLLDDWTARFDLLKPVALPAFGSQQTYTAFCDEYLAMLSNNDTLKFVLVLTTSGSRD